MKWRMNEELNCEFYEWNMDTSFISESSVSTNPKQTTNRRQIFMNGNTFSIIVNHSRKRLNCEGGAGILIHKNNLFLIKNISSSVIVSSLCVLFWIYKNASFLAAFTSKSEIPLFYEFYCPFLVKLLSRNFLARNVETRNDLDSRSWQYAQTLKARFTIK